MVSVSEILSSADSGAAQLPQKRVPEGLSNWHLGHFFPMSPLSEFLEGQRPNAMQTVAPGPGTVNRFFRLPSILPRGDRVVTSLRGGEATEAISQLSENDEIASLPRDARNDDMYFAKQSRGAGRKDGGRPASASPGELVRGF
jgi:hypothetical protein